MHDGEPCPGAPWQGLPYERQLAEKAHQVEDALRRLGHLDGFEIEPIEPAIEPWRYRNKLEYSFGERPGAITLGFHRRGSWSEIVDLDDCHLASEANNAARNAVRAWAHGSGLTAYDSRGRLRQRCAISSSARADGPGRSRPVSSPRPTRSRGHPSICTR